VVLDVLVLWSAADAPPATDELLTDPERSRLQSLRTSAAEDRFRSAHLLARVVVGRLMEVEPSSVQLRQRCPRCGGPHGRPIVGVPGRPRVGMSLSGAGGVVLAAAAFAEIGVDHEPCGAGDVTVAAVALTERERMQLAQRPTTAQPDALLRWWVRKEALLKMTGHGLLVEPSRLEISPPDEPPRLLIWNGPGPRPQVELADLDVDGAVAAVAVGTHRPLRVRLEHVSLSADLW
jgi:4'-phosphopantetheinyl transferase